MKILLSPAKNLDYDSELPTSRGTQPKFKSQIAEIIEVMKDKSAKEIAKLMSISDDLAQLNYERYQNFEDEFNKSTSRPAIYAFAGDVYTGLDAYDLDTDLLDKAQDSIRILSGLYGYLRPLDFIQPYRLEMGTKLPVGDNKNLYGFWQETVTDSLNKEITADEVVVNLASNEYFKVVNDKQLNGKLITPVFKDFKNGKLKVIAFYAKKARGSMTRFLIENEIDSLDDLKAFSEMDYKFSEKETSNPHEPVFTR